MKTAIDKAKELLTGKQKPEVKENSVPVENEAAKEAPAQTEKSEVQKENSAPDETISNDTLKEDPALNNNPETEKEIIDFAKGNFEFGFRFVEGMKVVDEFIICGEGETETSAMIDARNKADKFSDGKYTVVYTGYFKVK